MFKASSSDVKAPASGPGGKCCLLVTYDKFTKSLQNSKVEVFSGLLIETSTSDPEPTQLKARREFLAIKIITNAELVRSDPQWRSGYRFRI